MSQLARQTDRKETIELVFSGCHQRAVFNYYHNEFLFPLSTSASETRFRNTRLDVSQLVRSAARWSVARAFPPGRFLDLILAHTGEVDIFNEARHQNILISGKFSP